MILFIFQFQLIGWVGNDGRKVQVYRKTVDPNLNDLLNAISKIGKLRKGKNLRFLKLGVK